MNAPRKRGAPVPHTVKRTPLTGGPFRTTAMDALTGKAPDLVKRHKEHVAFITDPTPANAVALAIADHMGQSTVDWPFIHALRTAEEQLRGFEGGTTP